MKKVFCTLEGALLRANKNTLYIMEIIHEPRLVLHHFWKKSTMFQEIPLDSPAWNKKVLKALQAYKEVGYEIVIVVKNLQDSNTIPEEMKENFKLSFATRSEVQQSPDLPQSIYIGDCFLDIPLFRRCENKVITGPWWFQWLVSLITRSNVNAIDTENGWLPLIFKSALNDLHYIFGIILIPIGLLFRMLNSLLVAIGDPLDIVFMIVLLYWPMLFKTSIFNEDIFWCSMVILMNIIFMEQHKVRKSGELQEYVFSQYMMGIYLVIVGITYITMILVSFMNLKGFILSILMATGMFFLPDRTVIVIASVLYPFITHRLLILQTFYDAMFVIQA